MQEFRITKTHAFPFSAHQKGASVPAGRLSQQVPLCTKKERMQQTLSLAEEIRTIFKQTNTGVVWPVLLEKKQGTARSGRTSNYLEAVVPDADYRRGQVVETTYTPTAVL